MPDAPPVSPSEPTPESISRPTLEPTTPATPGQTAATAPEATIPESTAPEATAPGCPAASRKPVCRSAAVAAAPSVASPPIPSVASPSVAIPFLSAPADRSEPPVPAELPGLLARPLAIRGREVDGRLMLAPMAGLGHVALRELLMDLGAPGLLFTEMCNARAVPTERPASSPVFTWTERQRARVVCQIFGGDPADLAEAARWIERHGLFGVDINMGCAVGKFTCKGYGAALLREPERAVAVVRAVRAAVDIPVGVKLRTGWSDDPDAAVDLCRRLEDAGADLLTFHPRVAPDVRTRPPRWNYIRRVKEAVSIPVLGNGNVLHPDDCLRMLRETGCDGVSLGRLAAARPQVFAQWTGRAPFAPLDAPVSTLDASGSAMDAETGAASRTARGESVPSQTEPLADGEKRAPSDTPLPLSPPWSRTAAGSRTADRVAPHADGPFHLRLALTLVDHLDHFLDPTRSIKHYKRWVPYLCSGFRYGNKLRNDLLRVADLDEARASLRDRLAAEPELSERPSTLIFT